MSERMARAEILEHWKARAETAERACQTLGKVVEDQCRDALAATGRHDLIGEDGDGDWGTVWELLAELRPRAVAAEAKVARVEALRDEARQYDIERHPTPPGIDVPDDYERGVHDMAKRLTAALGQGDTGGHVPPGRVNPYATEWDA